MQRFCAFLRYPSFSLVLIAMLAALPGPPQTRWERLASFSLIGLSVGEVIMTLLLFARRASRSSVVPHLLIGCGALVAWGGDSFSHWTSAAGMLLILLGVTQLSRHVAGATERSSDHH